MSEILSELRIQEVIAAMVDIRQSCSIFHKLTPLPTLEIVFIVFFGCFVFSYGNISIFSTLYYISIFVILLSFHYFESPLPHLFFILTLADAILVVRLSGDVHPFIFCSVDNSHFQRLPCKGLQNGAQVWRISSALYSVPSDIDDIIGRTFLLRR